MSMRAPNHVCYYHGHVYQTVELWGMPGVQCWHCDRFIPEITVAEVEPLNSQPLRIGLG